MKIGFYDPSGQDFAPDTPYHRPLGGTQSAICYLAAALACRGHEVSILCSTSTPGEALGVQCRKGPFTSGEINAFDVVIVATRAIGRSLRERKVGVPLVLWQHMHPGAFPPNAFPQAEIASWNAVVFVSEDQRQTFRDRWGLDGQVLRNAASPPTRALPPRERFFFEDEGAAPTLIYASSPGRGLDFLLVAFAGIRSALPGARLRVFSSQGLYNVPMEQDPYRAFYALARALPGVEFNEPVSQSALAQAFATSDMLAYPSSFQETSCIVAIEAMTAGCLVAATDLGALRETCGDAGDLMPFVTHRHELTAGFTDLVVEVVNRSRAHPAREAERRRAFAESTRLEYDWNRRAEDWTRLLAQLP